MKQIGSSLTATAPEGQTTVMPAANAGAGVGLIAGTNGDTTEVKTLVGSKYITVIDDPLEKQVEFHFNATDFDTSFEAMAQTIDDLGIHRDLHAEAFKGVDSRFAAIAELWHRLEKRIATEESRVIAKDPDILKLAMHFEALDVEVHHLGNVIRKLVLNAEAYQRAVSTIGKEVKNLRIIVAVLITASLINTILNFWI